MLLISFNYTYCFSLLESLPNTLYIYVLDASMYIKLKNASKKRMSVYNEANNGFR